MAASSDGQRWDQAAIDAALADGQRARHAHTKRRFVTSLAFSGAVTLIWLLSVTLAQQWGRVADHWVSALTMVFGSFVAGATPQGGGAVAFPVFTKVLDVPAEAARSFSLCIQTVGMGCASASILINRRTIEWRSALTGAGVGASTMLATLLLLGDRTKPFWPVDLPGPYVKVTFTIVLLSMAWVVILSRRVPVRSVTDRLPDLHLRLRIALVVAGAIGGVAAALVGSGVDLMIYLFVVVLFGVRAGVGVPTSVVAMALVSMVGFVVLGLLDGQFATEISRDGLVAAIGGEQLTTPLTVRQGDLFGMWLAAAPIVAWGAPVGSIVASRMTPTALVRLVVTLSAGETLSTIIFLDDLRTDRGLLIYGLVGSLVALGGLTFVASRRQRLFGLPPLEGTSLLTRNNVEVDSSYVEDLR
ncbi:MAG: TSUP family transporter [Acidimicrobiales bacterium]